MGKLLQILGCDYRNFFTKVLHQIPALFQCPLLIQIGETIYTDDANLGYR